MIKYHNNDERMDAEMWIYCDKCATSDEFAGTWNDCIYKAKQSGWKMFSKGDSWEHFCSDCK